MNIFDFGNIKTFLQNTKKNIFRINYTAQEIFVHYGIEAIYFENIKNARATNEDHDIHKKVHKSFQATREFETHKQADSKARNFISIKGLEESENLVVQAIKTGKIELKRFPTKGIEYFKEIYQEETHQEVSQSTSKEVSDYILHDGTSFTLSEEEKQIVKQHREMKQQQIELEKRNEQEEEL